MTEEEFLQFERASLEKHEYYRGEVFPLGQRRTVEPAWREQIAANLRSAIAVLGVTTDLRILPSTETGYPDVSVVRGENPVLFAGVLSPSTEAHDRGFKAAQYRKIASLQEYVLVSQTEPRLERYRREPNGDWSLHDIVGIDAVCELASVDCTISLSGIYDKVDFEAAKA
jgi:Uma2 family endonuclease